MLVIDDLLVRPFVSLLDILQTMALEELYDVDRIRDDLKETQLLYEIGELDEEEYRRRRTDLEEQLELAEQVREDLTSGKIEVKN
ncbi:gas vesicle protein GvpG [Natronoarchaeum rubrum]|uniref:gas vesicle protein GvpG n=1 Tax=Natronoarchaeum rubrum TaxID=755311 RepID=UPI002111D68F|nr:protein gvpG [Natronoarchaeum rubrum]HMB49289.1 protein gvpG [Natronoarchaeum rubrum]